ncbi:MAG: carboxymuconolactone decarboxylase family protein [Rhodobiaceae bacterium]|nr:carboxymuconolactone decarboxylase family protein [Rhodobiaceae bacterium]
MARLPYPDPKDLSAENRDLMAGLPPLNVFRMMSGAGASFAPFMQFISAYLNEGVLGPELRELVILRVGHLCGSSYEVHQHERVSRTLGMSEDRIQAVKGKLPHGLFNDAENAALLFTDEQVAQVKVSDTTFNATHAHLTDPQIVELTIIVGTYLMVCRFLETLEIELEETDIDGSGLEEIEASVKSLNGSE